MAEALGKHALPCPACRMRGASGLARIGNKRNRCAVCNRFAQAARRMALARLMERFPDDYDEIRVEVEMALYPGVIEQFLTNYPAARPT